VVLSRLVVGALTLAAVAAASRQRLPRDLTVWAHLGVTSVLLCTVPFLLFAWAQQSVSSGLASIYNATTPLMTTVAALAALPGERPTPVRLAGLATGFLGVLVVLAPWRGIGGGPLLAQGACLLATASYGAAFVYLRRFVAPRGVPAIPSATVQVGLAAGTMLCLAPVVATSPVSPDPGVVLGVLVLGALGTGLAYVWNTNVVAGWGATNASTVTYLTPLVGVTLGALVLGEAVTWNQPVGAVVVVLGIALGQGRLRCARPQPPRPGARWVRGRHRCLRRHGPGLDGPDRRRV
jgi:drug/metabolite transporter (DMT)-like permease